MPKHMRQLETQMEVAQWVMDWRSIYFYGERQCCYRQMVASRYAQALAVHEMECYLGLNTEPKRLALEDLRQERDNAQTFIKNEPCETCKASGSVILARLITCLEPRKKGETVC